MFLNIVLIVIVMAVGATLLTKAMVSLMGRLGGNSIYQLHSSAEYIVHNHRVPSDWRERLEKRYRGLRDDSLRPEVKEAHRRRAKRIAIRRLDKLIEHFSRTSLVVDEEARAILVTELGNAREKWASSPWDEIVS